MFLGSRLSNGGFASLLNFFVILIVMHGVGCEAKGNVGYDTGMCILYN